MSGRYRKDGSLHPSRDPNCQRYIDDPEYTWYRRRWRTKEGIEKERATNARYEKSEKGRAANARKNARQIRVGKTYVGREGQFPYPREVVEKIVGSKLEALREKQKAEYAQFAEQISIPRTEGDAR